MPIRYNGEDNRLVYGSIPIKSVMAGADVCVYGNDIGYSSIFVYSEQTNGTLSINGLTNKGKQLSKIVIPEKINNKTVASISNESFIDNQNIQEITIPYSIVSIGNSSFSGCKYLSKIYWNAASATDLLSSSNVFYNAGVSGNGIDVVFGESVEYIPAYLFYIYTNSSGSSSYSPKIKSVMIGNEVKNIGDYAFAYCEDITSIIIGNNVTTIGDGAFCGCGGLMSIDIPNCVSDIGAFAFGECSGLSSITIPDSVTSIGNNAFAACRGLTSITISNGVTSIGDYVFYNCSGLTSVTIPDSVTSIGSSAFENCSSLESITLSNNITEIAIMVFANCKALTQIIIPYKVKTIDARAFEGCAGLKSIVIPDRVTSIGRFAFRYCSELEDVTIGSSVNSMSTYVFDSCDKLTSATFKMLDGWQVARTTAFINYTSLSSDDLSNVSTAAIYLRLTYVDEYWRRV